MTPERLAAEVDAKLTQLQMFSILNLENKKLAFKYLQELELVPGPMMDEHAGSGEQEVI